ncbi:jg5972 [Pararge aegeria aegeria]|uniref:Jg5972 protein n=1 Tax=Pararge aegeria aegeria TaxID=348720 RepID=A0A8S4R091_9NEOP|nr:jg5972 [Pararge aegeria aegeria]
MWNQMKKPDVMRNFFGRALRNNQQPHDPTHAVAEENDSIQKELSRYNPKAGSCTTDKKTHEVRPLRNAFTHPNGQVDDYGGWLLSTAANHAATIAVADCSLKATLDDALHKITKLEELQL